MFEEVEVNNERWLDLENLKNEEWKEIKDYEGLYQISNYGRIRIYNKVTRNKRTNKKNWVNKILKVRQESNGYCRIDLYKNKIQTLYLVHRLVAKAFIPNPKNKPQVNHKNSIRNDNRVINLEFCNNSENQKHAFKYGNQKLGYQRINSKIKKEDIYYIRSSYEKGVKGRGYNSLGKEFGISGTAIKAIVMRKSYKNIY